eukprot:5815826-Amphidinium_carterae.1
MNKGNGGIHGKLKSGHSLSIADPPSAVPQTELTVDRAWFCTFCRDFPYVRLHSSQQSSARVQSGMVNTALPVPM